MSNHNTTSLTPLRSDFADDPEMNELVEFFVGELDDRVNALTTACSGQDWDTLRQLAHQLKGAGGGYGFPAITDAAASLEDTLKGGTTEVDQLTQLVQSLTTLCQRAVLAV